MEYTQGYMAQRWSLEFNPGFKGSKVSTLMLFGGWGGGGQGGVRTMKAILKVE